MLVAPRIRRLFGADFWVLTRLRWVRAPRPKRVFVFGPCVFLRVTFAEQEIMRMQNDTETPLWMRGNYAPVREEATAFDLRVEGAIPPELCGLYARNGATHARA